MCSRPTTRSGCTGIRTCVFRRKPGCIAFLRGAAGAEAGRRSAGGRWARAGVASGSGDCPPAARPRRERPGTSPRSRRRSASSGAKSRCRHDDVASRLDPLRRRRRQQSDGCAGLPTFATRSSPASSARTRATRARQAANEQLARLVAAAQMRSHASDAIAEEARARPARNRPHDRERLRLRRLRGPRVPAGPRFRSRTPEASSGSETRVRSCKRSTTPASTRSPGSSATSAAPIESGPSRSGSETGSS